MIFITGATGRLGIEVLRHLPNGAVALVRKKSDLKNEIVTDFSEARLERMLKKADAMVHLAGSLDFGNKKALHETNVKLTQRIVNSLPPNARMVYASSTAVYGKNITNLPADENTPLNPDNDYAKSKAEAEAIVAKRKNSIIIRMPPIYGGEFEDYYAFISRIHRRKAVVIGNGSNHVAFVQVQDAAKAIANSIKATVKPGIYVLSGNSLTQNEVYAVAARALNVAAPKKHISKQLAFLFSGIAKIHAKITGNAPGLTREQIEALASDRSFDCKKARKELKFRPRELENGIREMVKYYLERTRGKQA